MRVIKLNISLNHTCTKRWIVIKRRVRVLSHLTKTLTYETKVKGHGWRIQADFHEENTKGISPSYDFLIVLSSKLIKKRSL